jgi:hypothetical protein
VIAALGVAEGTREDRSLVTQFLERLPGRNVTKIKQHFMPKSRIKEMRDGVLRSSHIEVDGHPVLVEFLRPWLLIVCGIKIAQIVPA